MAVVADGKPAVTHYRIAHRFKHYTQLQVNLETGRTHQIRVHLAAIGLPIVGDAAYGCLDADVVDRHALHAWTLRFPAVTFIRLRGGRVAAGRADRDGTRPPPRGTCETSA